MKNIKLSILLFLVVVINLSAQNNRNIVLKTNNEVRFIAYVNQQQINNQPMSEVIISGLTDDYYNVKIKTVLNKTIQSTLYAAPFSEIIYVFSNRMSSPNQNFKIEAIYPLPNNQNANNFIWNQNNSINTNNNLGQINININNQVNTQQNNNVVIETPADEIIYVEGYDGDIGCEIPVNSNRFESMLATIKNQDFASSKKRVAKQIISSNCILTDNLVEILNLFDFESSKLEVAKFAYDYTYDIENYYKINNVFDFESSKEKLDKYLQSK